MSTTAKVLAGVCSVLLIGLLLMLHLYGGLKDNYRLLSVQFTEQITINNDYKSRIQSLHQLDTQYMQELTNAKTEIDSLRDAVKSGDKRVHVRAECPKTGTDTTTGMDDGRPATLARDAEQDYFHLRKQLETMDAQIRGLHDYIKTQCLAK